MGDHGTCQLWTTENRKVKEDVTGIREEPWNTYKCITGWYMKGIMERRDIASVTAVARSPERKLVAVADNLALIRLFRWPSPYPTAQCKRYAAHNPFITNVSFGG